MQGSDTDDEEEGQFQELDTSYEIGSPKPVAITVLILVARKPMSEAS